MLLQPNLCHYDSMSECVIHLATGYLQKSLLSGRAGYSFFKSNHLDEKLSVAWRQQGCLPISGCQRTVFVTASTLGQKDGHSS